MSILQFANQAQTTLASSLAPSTASLTVATGTGGLFPALSTGQTFYLTLTNAGSGSNNPEICLCTARSSDVLTVERGQDGTTAESWTPGANVQMLCNAGTQRSFLQSDQNQQNPPIFGIAGGTVNAPTMTVTSGLTSLSDGMTAVFLSSGANTGAMTFDLTLGATDTGPQTIVTTDAQNIAAGTIPRAGIPVWLTFSGAIGDWVMISPPSQIATTAIPGVVELAQVADWGPGTDTTKALTAASTGSSNSIGANGYWQFQKGFTLQWGTTGSIGANTTTVITFPVGFLNECAYCNYSAGASFGTGSAMQSATSRSLTTATLDNTQGSATFLNWFALGY